MNTIEFLSSTAFVIKAVAADGKEREMVCLPLKFISGWLFSIKCRIDSLTQCNIVFSCPPPFAKIAADHFGRAEMFFVIHLIICFICLPLFVRIAAGIRGRAVFYKEFNRIWKMSAGDSISPAPQFEYRV